MREQILKSFVEMAFKELVKQIDEKTDTCCGFEDTYLGLKTADFVKFSKEKFGVDYSALTDDEKVVFIEALRKSWVDCFCGYAKITMKDAVKHFPM